MEEKNIKITVNVECTENSCAKEEQIAGYLLRAIAGVTANNKCLITNYTCEITGKTDNKLRKGCIPEKPKLTKEEKRFLRRIGSFMDLYVEKWIWTGISCKKS